MDSVLYGVFLFAEFGLPIAAVALIIFCLARKEVPAAHIKGAGLVLLWIVGGVVFSVVVCRIMQAHGEAAERVAFLIYCAFSALIYLAAKKKDRE